MSQNLSQVIIELMTRYDASGMNEGIKQLNEYAYILSTLNDINNMVARSDARRIDEFVKGANTELSLIEKNANTRFQSQIDYAKHEEKLYIDNTKQMNAEMQMQINYAKHEEKLYIDNTKQMNAEMQMQINYAKHEEKLDIDNTKQMNAEMQMQINYAKHEEAITEELKKADYAARQAKIDALKRENMAMKENATAAQHNLGVNLGMLFGIMGVARAVTTTTTYLERYGIVSEKTGKRIKLFGDTVNLISQFMSAYLSVYMLLQALESRRVKTLIDINTQEILKLQTMQAQTREMGSQIAMKGAAVGLGTAGIGGGAAMGASAGMASAIPYVGAALTLAGIAFMGYSLYKQSKHWAGTDEMVTSPHLMLVGERGPERVNVSPMGTSGGSGGGNTYNIFVDGYQNKESLRNELAQIINNVNRGRA